MKTAKFLPLTFALTAILLVSCHTRHADEGGARGASLRVDKLTCYGMNYALELGVPMMEGAAEPGGDGTGDEAIEAAFCSCLVVVGQEVPLVAIFTDPAAGTETIYFEDLVWTVSNPTLAEVREGGVLYAKAPGVVSVTACLGQVCSAPYEITIVTLDQVKVVALQIYPGDYYAIMPEPIGGGSAVGGGGIDPAVGGDTVVVDPGDSTIVPPWPGDTGEPPVCLGCYFDYSVKLLIGDTLPFFAQGILETGAYLDLTREVKWESSDPAIGEIDGAGLLSALTEGAVRVKATYRDLTSNEVEVEVLKDAVLQGVYIYRQSFGGIVKVGGIEQFHAVAFYEPWLERDVTDEVEWVIDDPALGEIDGQGVFTALAPGQVSVKARLSGLESNLEEFEVWDEVGLEFCDPHHPNRAIWQDEFNRVILETDCAFYQAPDQALIRFSIEEKKAPEWGILDPCLDLSVLKAGTDQIVKTLRIEGCGDLPFALGDEVAGGLEPIYQYLAGWDLTDDAGAPVAPGDYTIAGRFYIYYDPVIRLDVTVK